MMYMLLYTGNAGRVWRRVPHKCRVRGVQPLGPACLLLVIGTQGAGLTSALQLGATNSAQTLSPVQRIDASGVSRYPETERHSALHGGGGLHVHASPAHTRQHRRRLGCAGSHFQANCASPADILAQGI